ncbi:MAG TPA: pitrilysin family protein [Acidimicrobiales bacterium]|nr:pitrilysin family protein [Acidimicrobiales bacterium]
MTALIPADRAALVPAVGRPRPVKLPTVESEVLPNGLRVLAARRAGVPLIEARLVVPTARGEAAPSALVRVMARTLLAGTSARSAEAIAEVVQGMGGSLDALADEEDVVLTGGVLATHAAALLDLMAEIVLDASHPADEVALERDRMVQELTLARSQPETVAREALARRVFGRHPYGRGLPQPREVSRVRHDALAEARRRWLGPTGSVLVLVGDLRPERAIREAARAFGAWADPPGSPAPGMPVPALPKPGPTVLVDRSGAVQTNVRMAGPGLSRRDPDHPKLAVANLVLGGYFISRLSDNVRERRGYTYGISTGVQHRRQASTFTLQTDVGTEHTGPALVEIDYELRRMLVGPIEAAELLSAKRYLAGTLAMGIQTQAGLASYLATLALNDLPISYLRDFPAAAEAVTTEEVIDVSRRFFAPQGLVRVLVGDGGSIGTAVAALGPVVSS